jgi:hypothetical protein
MWVEYLLAGSTRRFFMGGDDGDGFLLKNFKNKKLRGVMTVTAFY